MKDVRKVPFFDLYLVSGRRIRNQEHRRELGTKIIKNLLESNTKLRKRLKRYED